MKKYITCLFCEHFYFHSGTPEYSEYTPAENAEIYCKKGFWNLDVYKTAESLREIMDKAKTCKEYIEVK